MNSMRPVAIAAIGFAAGIVLMSAGAVIALRYGLTYPCPFKYLTGLPCPTCGTTRALQALATLDLPAAIRFNPLLFFGPPLFVAALALRARFPMIDRLGWPLFAAGLVLNWLYLVAYLPR